MLRLTIRLIVESALIVLLGFMGLGMLVGTLDEYRSGKAFNRAMDRYSAQAMQDVHDWLLKAIAAKPDYAAPQEVLGKLYIDDGANDPKKYAEAKKLFEELRKAQEAEDKRPSLSVLVGLAVAELEAVRVRKPSREELRRAVSEARVKLDRARDVYPESGDLYVNLATVALLANNASLCKRHLAKAQAVGNISIDALPYLYNLSGLAALEEGSFETAVAEFAKVKEFAPKWEVPGLNLSAAYAQSLFRGNLSETTADYYARSISFVLGRLKKTRSPLVPLLYHALAVYNIRSGDTDRALGYFREAEKQGELSWHARFNRALGTYVASQSSRVSENQRAALAENARPTLERALRSARASTRDVFLAAAALGTLFAQQHKLPTAITCFERAAKVEPGPKDRFIREAMPRVHRSLAALYYATGKYKEALTCLEKSSDFPEQQKEAAALLAKLRTKPTVTDFAANMGKIVTDYDVRISATLAAPATPEPVTEKDVGLRLVNTTTKTTRELPFQLVGERLHALVMNLPQGHLKIELQVTDTLGNRSPVATKTFDVDREPPRVRDRSPAPGAAVGKLETVDFHVYDALGSVDFSTLSVILKYPGAARAAANRLLVARGKYVYSSKDGAVKKGSSAAQNVRAPVPEPAPTGPYTVTVRVRDVEGRLSESEWSFTVR